jgi:CrcB protein
VTWLLVALGAALGAPLRYVAGHLLDGRYHRGTILVNWAGSLLLGLFSGLGLTGHELALLGTGFCGGLTTYSSFAVQAHDRGRVDGSVIVAATVVPALLLCGLGFAVGAQA